MLKKTLFSILCIVFISFADNDYTWTETTQEDFKDGIYEKNIYASHLDGGTVEFAPRFDLNNDGYIDLFTADRSGPYVKIFWGSATGYSSNNRTLFPSAGAGNCDAADLNGDGYVDFLVAHSHEYKISIYWGNTTGPDPSNYFDIPLLQYDGEACFIADFNKDGYLDIAIDRAILGYGAILWGSATGYDFNNRTDLPCEHGQHNIEVADFNKDNWLDILFNDLNNDKIYWGSATGFVPANVTILPHFYSSHGASVADLDGNEYLDIIITHWYDIQSYVYWG
ncbi:VCBS repeat-containing protein, partial [candidate division WOR-3 bacterium]|nr:VCBS repeat-containing protein [candidate division WOR-3 bacterium]